MSSDNLKIKQEEGVEAGRKGSERQPEIDDGEEAKVSSRPRKRARKEYESFKEK